MRLRFAARFRAPRLSSAVRRPEASSRAPYLSAVTDTQHVRSADNETRSRTAGTSNVDAVWTTGNPAVGAGDTGTGLSSTAGAGAVTRTPRDAEIDHRGRYRNTQGNEPHEGGRRPALAFNRLMVLGLRGRRGISRAHRPVRQPGDERLHRLLRIETDFDRVRPDECPAENAAGQARQVVALERFEHAHRDLGRIGRFDEARARDAHAPRADYVRSRWGVGRPCRAPAPHVRKASRACQTIR